MKKEEKNFGKWIVRLRQGSGITQRQLGHFIGVSDKVISKWERGASEPDIDGLRALSSFFGMSVDDLLAGRLRDDTADKTGKSLGKGEKPRLRQTRHMGRRRTGGESAESGREFSLPGQFPARQVRSSPSRQKFRPKPKSNFLWFYNKCWGKLKKITKKRA